MATYEAINEAYFNWLVRLVSGGHYLNLLDVLHHTQFIYSIDMDSNRSMDGIELRYTFGHECGYSEEDISIYLDNAHCSLLEMMVALAKRIEDSIMTDDTYGNRTRIWFFEMIHSLRLDRMNDECFDMNYVSSVVDRFLSHSYLPNGEGGLFTVNESSYDMRKIEIWYQAMAYLNEYMHGGESYE